MQRTDSQRSNSTTPVGWRFVWLGLGILLAAWPAAVLGDGPEPAPPGEMSDLDQDSFWFSDRFTGRNMQSIGGKVRGGFISGPGIGREDGFFPLEFMPYSMIGDGLLFGDLRGFRTTQDKWGANVGFGYRQYVREWDRIFGINAYYDYDNSSTRLFRQWGLGLETYGAGWDMRLNTYFPLTQEQQLLNIEFLQDSVRFEGNNILFDQLRTLGNHMKGLDHELGVPLPGRISEHHDVRMYAGWYHFQSSGIDSAWGWKGRLQGNLLPNMSVGLEVSNDRVFDTNVVLTVAMSYGGYREPTDKPQTQFGRITTPVQRQYNIVVGRTVIRDEDLVALKPDGTPYFVEHVANDPNNPNLGPFIGTVEDPFLTIAQAQANPGGDIIFVHTNSVYDGISVDVNEEDVRILGEGDGVPHRFLLNPFGFVLLPRAINDPDPAVVEARPLFLNAPGDGATLSVSNTEFSGFQLGDRNDPASGPAQNGIFGTAITNVDVDFVDVNFAGADGILLDSVADVRFFRTSVFNAAGNGLHVIGGRPRVTFEGDGLFDRNDPLSADLIFTAPTTGESAVLIEDTLAGSFVDLLGTSGSAIHYTGAGGVLVQNSAGSAQFGNVFINSNIAGTGEAVNVINNSGAYTFALPVEIINSIGDSINIENMAGSAFVSFLDDVVITDRRARGIDLVNIAGSGVPNDLNVRFLDDVTIETLNFFNYVAANAIEYQLSSGNVRFFTEVDIDGGLGQGIVIGDLSPAINNSGIFEVRGVTTIDNIAGVGINIQEDDATVTFTGVDISNRGTTGINIAENRSPITFNVSAVVSNASFAFDTAVTIRENTNTVAFEDLTVIDAFNPILDSVAGVSITDNPGIVSFGTLNINTLAAVANIPNAGKALFGRRVGIATTTPVSGGLIVGDGIIDSINESAIDVQASVISMVFESVSSLNSAGPGIILANNTPRVSSNQIASFAILGDASGQVNSGGTITNSQLAAFNLESQTAPDVPIISGAGVLLRNTGVVSLNNMLINLNEVGIDAETVGLFIDNTSVIVNATFGLDALNILRLEVTDSTFTGNGPGNFPLLLDNNEIRSRVNLADFDGDGNNDLYVWLFDNNTIIDTDNSAVLIDNIATITGGAGAALDLQFTDNPIVRTVATFNPVRSAGLDVTWDGPLTAFIDNNTFEFLLAGVFGVQDNGLRIDTRSNLDLTNVVISNNSFQGTSFPNTGIEILSTGPSIYLVEDNTINMTQNLIIFIGQPATGMSFFLGDSSNTTIRGNTINITGEDVDGIVFQSINAPADVRIEDNAITLNDFNGTLVNEIGIDFQATNGVIDFFGDFDNVIFINGINGNDFPWFNFPINGQFTGSILVNGVPEP